MLRYSLSVEFSLGKLGNTKVLIKYYF